jgi:hypothetical protein
LVFGQVDEKKIKQRLLTSTPIGTCIRVHEIVIMTDTRLVFCNRKLMRTDIFFNSDHQTHMQFRKP